MPQSPGTVRGVSGGGGGGLFIVDNSMSGWTGLEYLRLGASPRSQHPSTDDNSRRHRHPASRRLSPTPTKTPTQQMKAGRMTARERRSQQRLGCRH